MSVASAVNAGRHAATSRMLDSFDIKVAADGWEYNAEDGVDEQAFTLLFSTPGRVKSTGLSVHEDEAGARTVASVVRELHIPVDSGEVPPGAVAFCTAVHATSDPTLLGARLRIAGPAPGSQTTAHRLQVSEVLS